MGSKTGVIFLLLLALISRSSLAQRLIVDTLNDPDQKLNLTSDGTGYQTKQLDMIWNITYPAEITFYKFDIDAQSGDFMVLCEYPLPPGDQFGDGAPVEQAVGELPLEKSLLLTSDPMEEDKDGNKRLTVRLQSTYGGFIYFHGTVSVPTPKTSGNDLKAAAVQNTFEGFHFQVAYFDLNPVPVTTTTTERLTTPAQGVDVYVYKHIIGRTPTDFNATIDNVKASIKTMAEVYAEKEGITLSKEIELKDIRLDNTTTFFCDRSIIYYETCVQIQFAVVSRDMSDKYVFTASVLETMWNTYAKTYLPITAGKGQMHPYEPKTEKPDVTWVWIAVSLGSIIMLTTLLCFIFAGGAINGRMEGNSDHTPLDFRRPSGQSNLSDPKHPIMDILTNPTSFFRGHESEIDEGEFLGMTQQGGGGVGGGGRAQSSIGSSFTRSKTNPMLQMKSYENRGYVQDELGGNNARSSSYFPSSGPTSRGSNPIFQAEILSPPDYDDDSDDMEIYNVAPGTFFT